MQCQQCAHCEHNTKAACCNPLRADSYEVSSSHGVQLTRQLRLSRVLSVPLAGFSSQDSLLENGGRISGPRSKLFHPLLSFGCIDVCAHATAAGWSHSAQIPGSTSSPCRSFTLSSFAFVIVRTRRSNRLVWSWRLGARSLERTQDYLGQAVHADTHTGGKARPTPPVPSLASTAHPVHHTASSLKSPQHRSTESAVTISDLSIASYATMLTMSTASEISEPGLSLILEEGSQVRGMDVALARQRLRPPLTARRVESHHRSLAMSISRAEARFILSQYARSPVGLGNRWLGNNSIPTGMPTEVFDMAVMTRKRTATSEPQDTPRCSKPPSLSITIIPDAEENTNESPEFVSVMAMSTSASTKSIATLSSNASVTEDDMISEGEVEATLDDYELDAVFTPIASTAPHRYCLSSISLPSDTGFAACKISHTTSRRTYRLSMNARHHPSGSSRSSHETADESVCSVCQSWMPDWLLTQGGMDFIATL